MKLFQYFALFTFTISQIGMGAAPGQAKLIETTPPFPGTVFLPILSIDDSPVPDAVPNQYIITLNQEIMGVSDFAASAVSPFGGSVVATYQDVMNGFVINVPPDASAQVLEELSKNPYVASIEADQYVTLDDVDFDGQANPTWGLDRIDQRSLPLDQNYSYTTTGEGVQVFVIDSGIRATHSEFSGRVGSGVDFIDGLPVEDCLGHGTHVAGTIGGSSRGVAKGVSLIPVRVFGCERYATTSTIIKGVEWVTEQKRNNPNTPMVANMSLGGEVNGALDKAIENSIAAGITYVVSAGNDNGVACSQSPAHISAAITVAAISDDDHRASYSNYGTCVDIFAPGSEISSASNKDDASFVTKNGTSMAAPHVSGAASLYLQEHLTASPAEVAQAILDASTPNVVIDAGDGSPNRLLYSLFSEQIPGPGANYLGNPGFESGGLKEYLNWNFAPTNRSCSRAIYDYDWPPARSGVRFLATARSTDYPNCLSVWQEVNIAPQVGQTYTAGFWIRNGRNSSPPTTQDVVVALWGTRGPNPESVSQTITVTDFQWSCHQLWFTPTKSGNTVLKPEIYLDHTWNADIHIDDVFLGIGKVQYCP